MLTRDSVDANYINNTLVNRGTQRILRRCLIRNSKCFGADGSSGFSRLDNVDDVEDEIRVR